MVSPSIWHLAISRWLRLLSALTISLSRLLSSRRLTNLAETTITNLGAQFTITKSEVGMEEILNEAALWLKLSQALKNKRWKKKEVYTY